MQLPDFQRSWVWDEDRIKSLIASISRSFPVGALMTLNTGGPVNFQPRPIEGAPGQIDPSHAQALLLDGQQRTTSMYQVTLRGEIVKTMTAKKKPVQRWFYLDINKCLDPSADREEAIIAVPPDRIVKSDFDRKIELDLSSETKEFDALMFPLSRIFAWNDWQMRFITHANSNGSFAEKWPILQRFYSEIVQNFEQYQVPVIALDKETLKEAVCTVFEKVNTGGKALDAFELVTAMNCAGTGTAKEPRNAVTTGSSKRCDPATRREGSSPMSLTPTSSRRSCCSMRVIAGARPRRPENRGRTFPPSRLIGPRCSNCRSLPTSSIKARSKPDSRRQRDFCVRRISTECSTCPTSRSSYRSRPFSRISVTPGSTKRTARSWWNGTGAAFSVSSMVLRSRAEWHATFSRSPHG
ncbi:DUF262 domain-containing protein [Aurantimonas sp. A2-1-M11]|uniref:DUF262 domain-containing protein n=1 Tax=Aurantimonas sp. A2-1-M11 TaxID=3113712 RepID=UPI002F9267A3